MVIIYLSDGYKGGNSTFLTQNINYNLENKNNVILIDKNPKKNFPKLKGHKNFKLVQFDIFKEKQKVKNYIKNLEIKNHFFFFTNFKTLIYYFSYFTSYKKKNIKIAMALHSGIFLINLKLILGLFLFSIIALKLDYLIFGSNSSKDWWLKKFPWMIYINNKVILNGVDLKKIKKKKPSKFRISFIGRLAIENDPKLFLDICKLNNKEKKITFNIFGDGILKNKLTNKTNNVKFWGWTDKEKIYKNTDISIITSPINNFPYVALESISNGIPIITAAKGDIRKIIKNNLNGYILKERTAKNFNVFIKKTIQNFKYLSKNSIIYSRKFDVKKSCKQIWKFLELKNIR